MSIWKKAVSVGTSAALLASLFTAIVAAPASAAITVAGIGTIAQGATSSGTATFTFTENSAAALSTTGSMTVTITPKGGGPGTVTFVGTPTISAPGSLGASVSGGGGTSSFTVTVTGNDPLNVETIVIGGLQIKASPDANPGAIVANLTGTAAVVNAFQATTVTATGKLAQAYGVASTSVAVAVDAASCHFTGATSATIGTESVTVTGVAINTPVPGQDTLTLSPATTSSHAANEVVTATATNCNPTTITSPGSVAVALTYATPSQLTVFPGETNAPAGDLTISENAATGAGYLDAGGVITAKIATAGVTFSTAPVATATVPGGLVSTITGNTAASPTVITTSAAHGLVTGNSVTIAGSNSTPSINGTFVVTVLSATTFSIPVAVTTAGTAGTVVSNAGLSPAFLFVATPTNSNPAVGTLSADRTSVSWTIKTASAALTSIVISGIKYDVAASVPGGTNISVGITFSDGNVQPTSRSNAVVARPVTATSTSTTVYIGENNQTAGTVSIVENSAGTFTDGTGSYNTFELCLSTGETFASAPSATVSAGDLQLRNGAVAAAAGTAVVGTPFTSGTGNPNCYYWTVWAASTKASTVTIGPLMVNVPSGLAAGNTVAAVGIGSVALFDVSTAIQLKVATRVFRNQVVVTALSQPVISAGSGDSLAGNIQIKETANGQLKAGETICVAVLPRTSNNVRTQDTFLKTLNTADRPVLTAENGIVLNAADFSSNNACGTTFTNEFGGFVPTPLGFVNFFAVPIMQQSVTGNGSITISNIHYTTTADAPNGPVLVAVWGLGFTPTLVQFEATVSNATIGKAGVADAWIAKGLNVRAASAFSLSTASVKRGTYVTIRAKSSNAPAGTLGQIWVKTKTTAWHLETSRRVGTDGYLYYSGKVLNLGYRYYKVAFVAGGTSNTVRGFGK